MPYDLLALPCGCAIIPLYVEPYVLTRPWEQPLTARVNGELRRVVWGGANAMHWTVLCREHGGVA